jgi:tetratricopeptide (TPR) repeat protein
MTMADYPAQHRAEIEKYERKHEENPEGRNFVPLANAYRKAGELELAEGLLREGLRRHPDYLSAHIVLGRVLADRGAAAEAATEFRHVLAVDPQNLIALRTMGELAAFEGRPDEAGYWYRELLVVDPMNDDARAALAEIQAATPADETFDDAGDWWRSEPGADPGESGTAGEVRTEAEDEGVVEGPAALVASEPRPLAHRYDDLLAPFGAGEHAEGETSDGEPAPAFAAEADRAPVDGELIDHADGDEPPVEYEVVPPADGRDEEADHARARERHAASASPGGLVSETLAELYARQGFTAEAAEMYRELIRRRGEEPGLVLRLAELEAGAERAAASAPPALDEMVDEVAFRDAAYATEASEAAPTAWEESAGDEQEAVAGAFHVDAYEPEPAYDRSDAFADSFSGGFGEVDDGAGGAGGVPFRLDQPGRGDEPGAGEAGAAAGFGVTAPVEDEPEAGSVTIAAYLGKLIGWRPATQRDRPDDGGGSWSVAPQSGEPWEAAAPQRPEAAAPAAAPERPEAAAPEADDEPFPWELPVDEPGHAGSPAPYAAAPPEPADRPPTAASTDADPGFDASPEQADGDAGEEPAPNGPRPAAEQWTGAPDGGDDDDDLESFQAWLRSLKR